jgi:hypothetical protein
MAIVSSCCIYEASWEIVLSDQHLARCGHSEGFDVTMDGRKLDLSRLVVECRQCKATWLWRQP